MATNRRSFMVHALDATEAADRAMDEAVSGNWRARVMRPDKWVTVKSIASEQYKVTLYVYEPESRSRPL